MLSLYCQSVFIQHFIFNLFKLSFLDDMEEDFIFDTLYFLF